ncbi:septin-8-like [Sinocyclocheilus grahami]|uniref:septin-8-like n=1 Tax=Sinocyclocheilus grahami TaxID=75366 RepID=UPI0007AD010C|nr:PREDICTED: septin-8-like [Sinocyclocheilus grahami]
MAATDVDIFSNEEKRNLSLGGHVGFDSLPDQLVSKSVTQGFCFNILCVGETGIGKSTLMNTLFNTMFENEEASHYQNGVYLRPRTYDLQESNVHLKLTIVDTVGFGDQINKEERYKNCLLLRPIGHFLKKKLKKNKDIFAHLPFAVVGSVEEVKVGNKTVRARQYPWGVVQVENESHCDFVKLREMLIRVNMEDLREQTHARHYELYRRCKLEEMGFKDTDPDSQPFSLQETYEAKRKEFLGDLQRKEEGMRQMFVNKVKETEAELKEKERELHEKFEQLKRMHQEEKRKVEEKRREMEEEMNAFNRRKVAAETLSLSQPLKKDKDKKNRSVKTENQSGVSLSSSKVMMAKANMESLNCQSWWQAIQCCSCLVHSDAWRQGLF